MKFTYKPNPLSTIIELDDNEKNILYHKIKIAELLETMSSINIEDDIKKIKEYSSFDYYYNDKDEDSDFEKYIKKIHIDLMNVLTENHGGDCTHLPAACPKCYVETMMGIDTLKGLNSYSGYYIHAFFNEYGQNNIGEVLSALKNYSPDTPGAIKYSEKWVVEARYAYEWLLKHKERLPK